MEKSKKKAKIMQIKDFLPTLNQQTSNMNKFKESEKFYRAYPNVLSDFSDVLDFNNISQETLDKNQITKLTINDKDVYEFNFPKGCILVKNCLSIEDQIEIGHKALNQFIFQPYRTNLFIYSEKAREGPWKDLKNTYNKTEIETSQNHKNPKNDQVKNKSEKNKVNDYNSYYFDRNIRWANLGAQYDWNNREYPSIPTQIPPIVVKLQQLGIDLTKNNIPDIDQYKAEAVIVNYYKQKDYMSGHLDDGEMNQKSPIFSFSFGLSCIFLIGETHKDLTPYPIRLDSGDLLVMAGYSRNCYHGVPRIIENSFQSENYIDYIKDKMPQVFQEQFGENQVPPENQQSENNYRHVINYLKDNRINLNFRQVQIQKD